MVRGMQSSQLSRLMVLALALAVGCGQEAPPPPAPVQQEFDDPFAEDAKEAAPEAKAQDTKVAVAEPAAPETKTEAVAAVEPAAVDAKAEPAVEAKAEPAVEAKAEPATAVAGKAEKTGEKTATKTSKPKTEPVPKDKSPEPTPAPAPVDSPPAPAPTPAPAPEPTPAPAPVAPAPPPQPVQNRFAGTFKFVGGEAQRTTVANAIETAVQELNALIRGIGRKRLTESNVIREQITIAVDGAKVSMTFAPGRTLTCTIDGPAVDWTSDSGKPVKVKLTAVKGRLVHNYQAEDGSRQSVYTLDDAGDKLTLSVTVKSDRLTNPIKYALSYKRN
jgi:hypothetical protein